MKIAIAGFNGLIGTHLIKHLKKQGHSIVEIPHRGDHLVLDERHADVEAVINLSGINIMHRWSESFKGHALSSRAGTAHDINHFYGLQTKKPQVFISASAIGYYGNHPHETLIEESPKGLGFLADLTQKWEKSTFNSSIHRVVAFRLGAVLSHDGGIVPKLLKLIKMHLGCILGDPESYFSWVHIEDVVRAFTKALDRSSFTGIYNLVSEGAVTQRKFMTTLASMYKHKIWFRVPKWLVKIVLGESASVILNDAKVYPKKLKLTDFDFLYPDLESALYSLRKLEP
jgi:uncharacterized protein (TIGR01777 family)